MRPFYVFDRWGKQVDSIAWPLSAIHKDVVNGEDSLTLTVLGDPLTKGQRIVWQDKFEVWHEHTVADTTTTHAEGQITETAYCENSISELLTDFLVEVEPRNSTSQHALERALENSRWITGTVQPTGNKSFSWYHQDAYSAVTNIVEEYGAELSVTIDPREDVIYSRKVNILNHRGSDLGHLFTYGRNLAGVERSVDTSSIYTALYGWGKGVEKYDEETGEPTGGYSRKISFADVNKGQAWVGDEDARLRYGVPDGKGGVKHAFGQVEFSDCEDANELLELTKEALKEASKPKVTYTGTVISLAAGGYTNGEDSQPGDTVYLRDRELDERLQGRVVEVDRDLLEESNTQLTLSNLKSRYTQRLADDMANLDWLKSQADKWDEAALLPDAYLDAVINRLNTVFNTTGGFCYFEKGEGLITYDKPKDQNPTMAIQITGAGFRIANSKKSDGSWDWRTFGTGDGFTADELITGIIKGGSCYWNLATGDLLFNQGIIRSANNLNYWNLGTGELSITSGTKVGTQTLDDYVNGLADTSSEQAAKDAVEQLEKERLTQQAIFNTLTNGGSTQGIYLKDGRVYINASYIGTGTLQAGKIQDKNGNNYWDLETGDFRLSPNTKVGTSSSSKTLSTYIDDKIPTYTDTYKTATYRDVFNKLTNNGTLKGIYLDSKTNDLYINATYIKSGAFDADLITTGKIQDKNGTNYWNLDTGEFHLTASVTVGTQTLQQYVNGIMTSTGESYVKKDSFNTYLTQKNVFNALTNNGVERGIYLTGTALYISGDFIRTGIIESTNERSIWNLNDGLFETSNLQTAGGQSHTVYSRLYNGQLVLRMDNTNIGDISISTSTTDANEHSFVLRAFTRIILSCPGNLSVAFASTGQGVNYTPTIYQGSAPYIEAATTSGTTVKYTRRTLTITQGMITGQSAPVTSDPGIDPPTILYASSAPASALSGGGSVEVRPIVCNAEVQQAEAEGRMIWQLDEDTGEFGDPLYNGETWAQDPPDLGDGAPDAEAAAPAYVDARAEVIQSELEAITAAVTSALPTKSAIALTKKIQTARAGLVSGDELQMAQIANDLSDTKPIFSVAQAKEVLQRG